MTELDNPIVTIVPNLATCINTRINNDKFTNDELIKLLTVLLSYTATTLKIGAEK